ncbi:MAG: elongation factor P maturation arginine rhamnosyltransferase EarP, partial [Ottowia sp.]
PNQPVWINLEYLSAEPYVERMHGLPSPVLHGPASGWTKWFFYPGFTPATGGLLREDDLDARQAGFDRRAWLARQGIDWQGEPLVSLFCYEPPALAAWIARLRQAAGPTRLLVTAGRAAQAVQRVLEDEKPLRRTSSEREQLSISYLPYLSQSAYDELLWACDLNFVRGEDSLVRALWAGQPFVWHIYPQPEDDAHHAKLHAFLDWLRAPASLRAFHLGWNGIGTGDLPDADLPAWRDSVRAARQRLHAQAGLCTQLIRFVAQKTL